MRNLFTLTTIAGAMAALALMPACQTTGTAQSAAARNEALLTQSGFKTIPVTTPRQQAAVSKLPQGTVSTVKHQGKTYYVYPSAANDKIYVGKQTHVNAAKRLVAQQTQAAQQSMNPPPTMTFQGHGPHQVVAEEYDGFGPMGVNSLGDW